jgi:hypothetical protein
MEYIDKNKNREAAHKLIKGFLKECLKEEKSCLNDLYSIFNGENKKELKEILLKDTDNHCCYCMRNLQGSTLEHVITQKVNNQEDFYKYFEIESELDKQNIILETEFLNNPKDVPPFPHTVAYENLIPSCLGTFASGTSKSCNNHRGDRFIQPLIFRKDIHNEIKYKKDGSVEWIKEEADIPTVISLGLNCLELKAIRRIWYYLSSNNISCDESNKDVVIYDIITELENEDEMLNMLMNFKKVEYWRLLSQYTYFNNVEIFEK